MFRLIRNYIQEHKVLCAIISLAIIAHLSLFITLKTLATIHPKAIHSSFPMAGGGFDSYQYVTLADNIIEYGNFSLEPGVSGNAETFRTPAYPFFVAIIKYFTKTLDAVPVGHIVLMALSAFLTYTIILSIFPNYKKIALVTVALFAFDPAVFYSTQFIATEALYTFTFLLCMFFLLRKSHQTTTTYTLAGIFFGLSALVRPSGLYMIIPIGVWFLWRIFKSEFKGARRKEILHPVLIFCLAAFLVISPWFMRNGVRTGVYALSSLDAYNTINFNLPVYLSYKGEYKQSIVDIRTDLHKKIGNLSDEEQMDLRNSALIKEVVWETLSPNLFSYAFFHTTKSANFFFSPALKLDISFFQGFFEGGVGESWHPQTSFINSIIDGRIKDVFRSLYQNIFYLPESIFLLIMFLLGLYWYWSARKSDSVKLIFLVVFFLALLTSPITNPRYRIPVTPFIYLAGVAGSALVFEKIYRKYPANLAESLGEK